MSKLKILLLITNMMNNGTVMKSKEQGFVPMTVVNPNAAGINVGETPHAVAGFNISLVGQFNFCNPVHF